MTATASDAPADGLCYLRTKLDAARHLLVVKCAAAEDIDDLLLEALDVVTGNCSPHLRVSAVPVTE